MLLDVVSDSDDDDDDDETSVCTYGEEDALADSTTTSTVEYTGTLNLEARHDSYRYSHEKGALSFAVDLLASMEDGDDDTDTEIDTDEEMPPSYI